MSTVAQAIARGRQQMRAMEPGMVQRMLDAYGTSWRHVEGQLVIVDGQIAAAAARGETVNPSWLNRQAWYRQVQASIDREMARFARQGVMTIAGTQATAVNIAQQVGQAYRSAIDISFAGRVNAGAMQEWISAIQPGSPVRGVMDRYGTRVSTAIERRITEGIGSGQGAKTITRQIVNDVGPDAVEGRLHTLTRNEGMRAYRGSFAESIDPLQDEGIVVGYRWLCTKSVRSCIACIARDGQFFEKYPTGFHVSCRCVARPVVNPDILPEARFETGADWFARQDQTVQRKMLKTDEHFAAYQAGMPLTDMVGERQSKTWGPSVYVKPWSQLAVGGR